MEWYPSFLKKLLSQSDHIGEVAWHYASLLDLRVTQTTLRTTIHEHPDYPSLLALSDVFAAFGAKTLAVKITDEQLSELDVPFIAQVKPRTDSRDIFTVVKPGDGHSLSYLDPERDKWIRTTIAEFSHIFDGVAFFAEPQEHAGEKDYAMHQKAETNKRVRQIVSMTVIPALILLSIAASLIQQGFHGLLPSCYLLLSCVGTAVGILLLWHEVDRHHPALRQVCSGGGRVNCDAILHSSASTFMGMSWSLIGFTFFSGLLIAQLVGGFGALQLLSWLSLLAVPYTVFSIYYQWCIAGQWCRLCLWTQGVLLLQAAVVLVAGWPFQPHAGFSIQEIVLPGVSFALPFLGAQLMVPALQRAKEGEERGRELSRLKHDAGIFQALLEKQKAVTLNPSGLGISLGNPDVRHQIIKVCNPYCGPCARAHPVLDKLLEGNPDVQLQIIFTAEDSETDHRALPVKHLMAIAEKGDEQVTRQALDDWYNMEKKDYKVFASNYPMNGELTDQGAKLAEMHTWCDHMGIGFTPTFFVNGHQLPEIYTIDDLKYFLKT